MSTGDYHSTDSVSFDVKFDWIPPAERSKRQSMLTGAFHEAIGTFEEKNSFISDLPERAMLYDLEIKATGKLGYRPHQMTGSCVGVGGARAYYQTMCGDVVVRGDHEEIIFPFPFATYGVGRAIAGMRTKGEGSFGGAQAKAIEQFGMLPFTDERLPTPTISGDTTQWIKWTSQQEMTWSHPSAWPIKQSELEKTSTEYQILDVTRITSFEGLLQALAQGYGVTTASMFGTRPRVENGVLLGRWNDTWAHQQSHGGYWKHSQLGYIVTIDNQWNDVHGSCPDLSKLGVNGSYWVLQSDIEKILRQDGEVYAHSNTEGFPKKVFDWGTMGIGE